MKRLMTAVMMVGLCAGVVQAQTKAAAPKAAAAKGSSAADELKKIENDWIAASKARDVARLGEILADDWVGQSWDGKGADKAKALADVKAPGNVLTSYEMGPMNVRFFGTTIAAVMGSDTEKSTGEGKDTSGTYFWTDVFMKQGGKWRAIASQSTRIVK